MNNQYALLIILTMSLVTMLLRFLPFMIFGKKETPKFVEYLGNVLPYAVMAMLVVYCLKGVSFISAPFAIPEIVSVIVVALIHIWKRNTLLSIVIGTVCYMILIRIC